MKAKLSAFHSKLNLTESAKLLKLEVILFPSDEVRFIFDFFAVLTAEETSVKDRLPDPNERIQLTDRGKSATNQSLSRSNERLL